MSRQVYKGVTLPPGVTLKVPGGAAAAAAAAAASDTETITTGTLPLSCRFYAHLPEQAGLFDLEGRQQQLDIDEKIPTFDHLSKYKRVAFHPTTTTTGDRCSWIVTVDEIQNIIIWNHSKRNIILRTHPIELEARRYSSIARDELLRRQSGGGGGSGSGSGSGGSGGGRDREREVKRRSTSTTSTSSTNAAETKVAGSSSSSSSSTSTITSISSSDTTSKDEQQQQQQQQRPKSPSSHPTMSSKQHRSKPPGSIRGVTFWVRTFPFLFLLSFFIHYTMYMFVNICTEPYCNNILLLSLVFFLFFFFSFLQ